jgi:hypothetical protein
LSRQGEDSEPGVGCQHSKLRVQRERSCSNAPPTKPRHEACRSSANIASHSRKERADTQPQGARACRHEASQRAQGSAPVTAAKPHEIKAVGEPAHLQLAAANLHGGCRCRVYSGPECVRTARRPRTTPRGTLPTRQAHLRHRPHACFVCAPTRDTRGAVGSESSSESPATHPSHPCFVGSRTE